MPPVTRSEMLTVRNLLTGQSFRTTYDALLFTSHDDRDHVDLNTALDPDAVCELCSDYANSYQAAGGFVAYWRSKLALFILSVMQGRMPPPVRWTYRVMHMRQSAEDPTRSDVWTPAAEQGGSLYVPVKIVNIR